MSNIKFMMEAVKLSRESIKKGGGPFGAVIVKDGEIIAGNHNRVTTTFDPTAHAEVNAIRDACSALKTWSLDGCDIYTSCEPCPMCLSAIYWAGISRIYYANTHKDAHAIGFSDSIIYNELRLPIQQRSILTTQIKSEEALGVFKEWDEKEDKVVY